MEEYEYTEHWMQRIVDRLDRLIAIGERLEGQVRLPSELEAKTFADAKEPAKEPEQEHPAGPRPDPGEGYRLLSKDPPEDLRDGDELLHPRLGGWHESIHARWGYKRQDSDCWYRRKIETPKDEYREPVLPADAGKRCEFSISGKTWDTLELVGWNDVPKGWPWKSRLLNNDITCWKLCRIKQDA